MRRLIFLGLAVYLLVVVRQFPANVAVNWFAPEGVGIHGVTGTVWEGSAEAISSGAPVTLGETDWTVSALWLLTGRVKGTLATQLSDTSRLNTRFSKPFLGDGLALSDTQGILDLNVLPAELRTNGVVGRIGLAFDSVDLNAMWPTSVAGSVDLVDLSITRPRRVELGSFEVVFDGQSEDPVVGKVTDTRSDIKINGTLSLAQDRSYAFEGQALAGPGADRNVADTLPLLGPSDEEGRVTLGFSGTID